MTPQTPLDCVLGLLRAIEAGGGAEGIAPFLADVFILSEAPNLLAPQGPTRNRQEALAGADAAGQVVSGQRFGVWRTSCDGGRVVVEADWSATLVMDLPHWDAGEDIRARIEPVFEVRDGRIVSQNNYDCYYTAG